LIVVINIKLKKTVHLKHKAKIKPKVTN